MVLEARLPEPEERNRKRCAVVNIYASPNPSDVSFAAMSVLRANILTLPFAEALEIPMRPSPYRSQPSGQRA
jgi:hypothetical protein